MNLFHVNAEMILRKKFIDYIKRSNAPHDIKGKSVPLQARGGPQEVNVPRVFQEVKVPRLRDNGTGWWYGCQP
jgi:hypothetical protein